MWPKHITNMMEVTASTMIGFITGIALVILNYVFSNLPWLRHPNPGICYPFLGHIHKFFTKEMVADPVKGLWDMYRKHQRKGVMWTRNFNMDILWVGDFDTLHYLFNHSKVQNRMNPRLHTSSELESQTGQEIPGVLQSEGQTWAEQRRFALRTLRDFGFGKSGMEQMIKEEVQLFTEEIRKSKGEPLDFTNKFNLPILNALWNVTVGQRFDYENPKLISLIDDQLDKAGDTPSSCSRPCCPYFVQDFPKVSGLQPNPGHQS